MTAPASSTPQKPGDSALKDDLKTLHSMGYAQELARRMSGFSNFAISFSLICILAGGITNFPNAICAGGAFSATIGFLVGGAFAFVVACSMGQIASAYPTAGGLYHWSAILGGNGWGWATAWLNLLALFLLIASVDVGAYQLFRDMALNGLFHVDVSGWQAIPLGHNLSFDPYQTLAVVVILASQALFNHYGIRLTSLLTDFSGYLIFAATVVLTGAMFYFGATHDLSRIFHFTNYTGVAGGGFYPQPRSSLVAFLVGLLYPLYTIAGYDASANTAEETLDARRSVPRAMLHAVVWSVLFGFVMAVSFVTAVPSIELAARNGTQSWLTLFNQLPMPLILRGVLVFSLIAVNYLCANAAVTSTSRMVYAFARDGGMPLSRYWKSVSHKHRTPVYAIWLTAALSLGATLYTPAFAALSAGCAVFLYISYAMPIGAGLLAEGKKWREFGQFRLGKLSKPLAAITVAGVLVLAYAGMQPPSDEIITYAVGIVVVLVVAWFAVEKRRFQGPPLENSRNLEELSKIEKQFAADN
jgi:amino acid transporter